MKTFKIALCLPIMALIPLSAQADPQPDPADQTSKIKKPHYKVAHRHYRVAEPRYEPAPAPYPVVAAVPAYAAPRPYDWSGFYVGVYAGVAGDSNNPRFTVPTNGTLQGNDIGFAPSAQYNSYSVLSGPYQALSNPTGPGGATYLGAGSYSATGNSGAGGTYSINAGGQDYNYGTTGNIASTNIQGSYYLNGNTTNSQFTTNNQSSRLLAAIGGEIGYRKQFGIFVFGIDADGGFLDGKRNESSTSNGQFSNTQGYLSTVSALGTLNSGNSETALSSDGSVTVQNNGNSAFSQSISAGPQWLGTARASAGVTMDRLLVYATGGLAYGEASIAGTANYSDTANSTCSGVAQSSPQATPNSAGNTFVGYTCNGGAANTPSSFTYSDSAQWSGSYSKVQAGYAVGTGAAYALTDNIIFKLEGYYYNLGTINTTLYGTGTQTLAVNYGTGPGGAGSSTRAASVTPYNVSRKIDGFIAKVALQFKFNTGTPEPAPVIAKY